LDTIGQLQRQLFSIDGKGYNAYKSIRGTYIAGNFSLYIDYVQGDPFVSPSRIRVRVDQDVALLPLRAFKSKISKVALEDYLNRQVANAVSKYTSRNRGTGKSGLFFVDKPGQQVLERTAVVATDKYLEARISLGLPAKGRKVLGKQASVMFTEELPLIVNNSLLYTELNHEELWAHVFSVENQDFLREQLKSNKLVAFIANDAILPRESGVSDQPLTLNKAVPFKSPRNKEVTFTLPNGLQITGMGIPAGVTLVVGGGYHGKSTLLEAIKMGIYNHIPGDGRELVVSDPTATKIRAEDGRRVEKVDISPFITNLPQKQDTSRFSSDDASGSTSQAANIMEALEIGSSLLLLDEDTSATNFMIRDVRMQRLVAKEKEPITPFIDKVRPLINKLNVSTIMVIGGNGDYFDVADNIFMLEDYKIRDVTKEAKEIAKELETKRTREGTTYFGSIPLRVPNPNSLNAQKGRKNKIAAKGKSLLQFGLQSIDLSQAEQIVDQSQTQAIGDIIQYTSQHYFNGRPLRQALLLTYKDIDREGLEIISPFYGQHPGDYALPRIYEVAAAINHMRTLIIQ